MKQVINSKPVIFFISALTLLVLTLSFYYLKSLSDRQNQAWIEFSNSEILRGELLQEIVTNIGFGGFIHSYKNAILRKDSHLLSEALDKVYATRESIDTYQKMFPVDAELLLKVDSTLVQYSENIPKIEQYISAGMSAEEIDKRVEVDDQAALLAIVKLITSTSGVSKAVSARSIERDEQLRVSLYFIAFIVLAVLIASFIYTINIINKITLQNLRLSALFELAPLSIMSVSEDGYITTANQVAIDMFKMDKDSYKQINIDQLTPASVSGRHKHYREKYHQTGGIFPMTDRGGKFSAQRLDGEIFPISISIMTHTFQGAKEAIVVIKDISEEVKQLEAANTDQLTQLPNRRAIDSRLSEAVSRSNRQGTDLYMALIDLDYFKRVNDKYGHSFGDTILVDAAQYLKSTIRETDFVGRWGGEEFLLILEDSTAEGALEVCEKIRLLMASESKKKGCQFTVSIGIAQYEHGRDIMTLFDNADVALYLSKKKGTNRTTKL